MSDVVQNPFKGRTDNFIDTGSICDNPIQEKWIMKEVVVKTGDGEDDWYIDLKPVKIDEINLQKEIHEAAKGTDLKSLILQVLRTGDESLLNQREGAYIDITGYPTDTIEAHNQIISAQKELDSLSDEAKSILAKNGYSVNGLTKEDIMSYINEAINAKTQTDVKEGDK